MTLFPESASTILQWLSQVAVLLTRGDKHVLNSVPGGVFLIHRAAAHGPCADPETILEPITSTVASEQRTPEVC